MKDDICVAGENRKAFTLKRRLRLRTVQLEVARNVGELYENTDSEVVLSILTHKVRYNFLSCIS